MPSASRNCTAPVITSVVGAAGATAAVNLTAWPATLGSGSTASVVVGTFWTVCRTAVALLAVNAVPLAGTYAAPIGC